MATTYDNTKDGAFSSSPQGLGRTSNAVTPSDTVDFTKYPKTLVVTAAGNLVVLPLTAADDGAHTITFTGLPVGFIMPFRVRRVLATGTTASVATIED